MPNPKKFVIFHQHKFVSAHKVIFLYRNKNRINPLHLQGSFSFSNQLHPKNISRKVNCFYHTPINHPFSRGVNQTKIVTFTQIMNTFFYIYDTSSFCDFFKIFSIIFQAKTEKGVFRPKYPYFYIFRFRSK